MGLLDSVRSVGSGLLDGAQKLEEKVADKVDSAVTTVKEDAAAVVHKADEFVDSAVKTVKQDAAAVANKADAVVRTVKQDASAVAKKADEFVHSAAKSVGSPAAGNILQAWRGNPTVSVGELKREWQLLKDTWKSPNTSRALETEGDLAKLKMGNLSQMGRLTPQIDEALVRGVAERQSSSDRGQMGILGRSQARDAAQTVMKMNAPDYEQLQKLLADAGKGADGKVAAGADPQAERALILKAVAARKDALTNPDPDVSGKAMKEISDFAKQVRGTERSKLIDETTPLDVNDANTSGDDPLTGIDGDTKGDNDGMAQKYDNTCAPTTGQILRAQNDPVYALALNKDGLSSTTTGTQAAKDEAYDLKNGKSFDGVQRQAVTRDDVKWRNGVVEDINKGPFTATQKQWLTAAVSDGGFTAKSPAEQKSFDAALKELRKTHPELDEKGLKDLQRIDRDDPGMEVWSGVKMGSGQDLKLNNVDPSSSDEKDKMVSDLKSRLKNGESVAFRIGYYPSATAGSLGKEEGGHAMMVADYRDGKFLVHDPYSGKTGWVTEQQVKDGTFARDFDLTSKTGHAFITEYYTK